MQKVQEIKTRRQKDFYEKRYIQFYFTRLLANVFVQNDPRPQARAPASQERIEERPCYNSCPKCQDTIQDQGRCHKSIENGTRQVRKPPFIFLFSCIGLCERPRKVPFGFVRFSCGRRCQCNLLKDKLTKTSSFIFEI